MGWRAAVEWVPAHMHRRWREQPAVDNGELAGMVAEHLRAAERDERRARADLAPSRSILVFAGRLAPKGER